MMGRNASPKNVIFYCNENGEEPFLRWLENLRDRVAQKRIIARIRRLEQGNYGDCKVIDQHIYELRFFFGSGYRVYFAEDGADIVILLCGGDKKSQSKDIKLAKIYWSDYQNDQNL